MFSCISQEETGKERGNNDNSHSGATGSTVDQHDPLPVG
jgi:hypothetical protein